jgi:Fic family protein
MNFYLDEDFLVKFCHDSCAIEGNSLTLAECTLLLKDEITPNAKKLREIFEPFNTKKAFEYILKKLPSKLDENILKDIHQILMENIEQGGIYRSENVKITGSEWVPPIPTVMYEQLKLFWEDLNSKQFSDSIEKAAFTHAEFVKIHPFRDGNGRTARMIMNYQLLFDGCEPVNIKFKDRLEYYKALEDYNFNGDLDKLCALIRN